MMTLDTSQHSIDVLQDFANIIRWMFMTSDHIKSLRLKQHLVVVLI